MDFYCRCVHADRAAQLRFEEENTMNDTLLLNFPGILHHHSFLLGLLLPCFVSHVHGLTARI